EPGEGGGASGAAVVLEIGPVVEQVPEGGGAHRGRQDEKERERGRGRRRAAPLEAEVGDAEERRQLVVPPVRGAGEWAGAHRRRTAQRPPGSGGGAWGCLGAGGESGSILPRASASTETGSSFMRSA